MKYRVRIEHYSNGVRSRYIPQVHVFWKFWSNVMKDDKIERYLYYCHNETLANKIIEAHRSYYKVINGPVLEKIEIKEYSNPPKEK